MVKGPQSALPFPNVNEATSLSDSSTAAYAPRFFLGNEVKGFTGPVGVRRDIVFSQLAIHRHDKQCRASFTPRMPINFGNRRHRTCMVVLSYLQGPKLS